MSKKKHRKKPGSPPGTLVFTGRQKVAYPYLISVTYDREQLEQTNLKGKILPETPASGVQWLDVRGLSDIDLIEQLGQRFHIHPLVLEDVLNTDQRPKFEEYDNGVFIVLQSLTAASGDFRILTEQVGIFITGNTLISFQEDEEDLFLPVRERLQAGRGRIRGNGPDYLGYALLDAVVDNYFLVIDRLEEEIETVEDEILKEPNNITKARIHRLKLQALVLRKSISPLREAIGRFSRSDSQFVQPESQLFYRDLYDHLVQLMDLLETHRDVLNGLYDLYLSEISYRMNNVMRLLTVISTIFIPLTFLAGIYGMNFENMPELHWRHGYYYFWAVILVITGLLLFYFRRKKWL